MASDGRTAAALRVLRALAVLLVAAEPSLGILPRPDPAAEAEATPGSATSVCPRIVPRDEWGARPPKAVAEMHGPVSTVVIHHTYEPAYCADAAACVAAMQSMQHFHQDDRGWDDIGYSFAVGGDGRVYKGRGWNRVGAHAPPYNADSIGITLIGDWTAEAPPKVMLDTVQWLIRCGVDSGRIAPDYQLIGHRQARDTECPGNALYAVVQGWERYTADPQPPKARPHHLQQPQQQPQQPQPVVAAAPAAPEPTAAAAGTYDPRTPSYAERDAVEVRQLTPPEPWALWHLWYQRELTRRAKQAERAELAAEQAEQAAEQAVEEELAAEQAGQQLLQAQQQL